MKNRRVRNEDGTFGRKLEPNQKVMHGGLKWRVCKFAMRDDYGHLYNDIQRGSVKRSVRTDSLKVVKS